MGSTAPNDGGASPMRVEKPRWSDTLAAAGSRRAVGPPCPAVELRCPAPCFSTGACAVNAPLA
eukprot:2484804-Alexandrium_andersonii.AAC.1